MSSSASRRSRAPWIATAVLSAVAIALGVTLVVGHLPSRHSRHSFTAAQYGALTETEQAAVVAAKQVVINTLTYKRATFNADFARTLAGTTGALKSDITKDKATLLKTMTDGKFDLSGTVQYAGLESDADGGYVVLVSATGNKITSSGSQPVSAERLAVTVGEVHGTWLASDFESVGLT